MAIYDMDSMGLIDQVCDWFKPCKFYYNVINYIFKKNKNKQKINKSNFYCPS